MDFFFPNCGPPSPLHALLKKIRVYISRDTQNQMNLNDGIDQIIPPIILYFFRDCSQSQMEFPKAFIKKNYFCKLSALYSCTCNGKSVVNSDADCVSASKQRAGSQKQRIGREFSSICWSLSFLRWETSHYWICPNYVEHGNTGIFVKTIHHVHADWGHNALAPWSPFLSSLPRICFLQLLFLLSIIFQIRLGNIRRRANTTRRTELERNSR